MCKGIKIWISIAQSAFIGLSVAKPHPPRPKNLLATPRDMPIDSADHLQELHALFYDYEYSSYHSGQQSLPSHLPPAQQARTRPCQIPDPSWPCLPHDWGVFSSQRKPDPANLRFISHPVAGHFRRCAKLGYDTGNNMGYDHAAKKEVALPSSSSECSGSGRDEILSEKPNDRLDRRDTARTASDDGAEGSPEGMVPLQHTQTAHHLGKLTLRPVDDDDPSDWWFASTAIPLIAATFAPMANVLSIAALVVSWRAKLTTTSPSADETAQGYDDPHWCVALNIASLVCGFVGNLFLLFNFTKRVRYIVALPATIICFYFACGILIGITSSLAIHVPPGPGDVYSQGFWHAIIAACLYFFCSMMLMINMLGYFLGHYPQHFTLTDEQRNLILQTMMFFLWLAGGAAVYCRVEGWSYVDALYFCDVTVLTVGFGDFYPSTNTGRGLVLPFSVGGIIILGLMVSSIHKFAGELSKDNVIRKHMENRRVNTLSRAITLTPEDQRRDDLEKQLAETPGFRPTISSPIPNFDPNDRQIQFAPDEAKAQKDEETEPAPSQFMSSKHHRGPIHRTFMFITAPVRGVTKAASRKPKALIMKEEKDRFDAMRGIQTGAAKFKKWYALLLSVIAFGTLWCVGAIVFWQAEKNTQGMTYFQALYFCYVSLLTIGYGDLSPKSNAGKPFFVVWSLIAVPTMTILISDMGDTVISSFKQGTFKLADFTVLPKEGLFQEMVDAHPWLRRFMRRREEQKRIKRGLKPEEDVPIPTIDELASEDLSEAELTKKLAFAIRRTAEDMKHHEYSRYTYEEWVEFTRLIRFTRTGAAKDLEHDEETEGIVQWDWLSENSPMLSEQSEAEWVLDRLCESLLRLLKNNRLATVAGTDGGSNPDSAATLGEFGFSPLARKQSDDEIDPKQKGPNQPPPETTISPTAERRQRAIGADKLLTFFTGDRRGEQAYAKTEAVWSARAMDRMNERRRSSAGLNTKKRGPFKLVASRTGAMGGGRGGAGTRTLKARAMYGSVDRGAF